MEILKVIQINKRGIFSLFIAPSPINILLFWITLKHLNIKKNFKAYEIF